MDNTLIPHYIVTAIQRKFFTEHEIQIEEFFDFDITADGSDNSKTKIPLNMTTISVKIPLVTASVNHFKTMTGIFIGHLQDESFYNYPLPHTSKNSCNYKGSGVLGAVPGLPKLYQAYLVLCYLLDIIEAKIGTILLLEFETFRIIKLQLGKTTPLLSVPNKMPNMHIRILANINWRAT